MPYNASICYPKQGSNGLFYRRTALSSNKPRCPTLSYSPIPRRQEEHEDLAAPVAPVRHVAVQQVAVLQAGQAELGERPERVPQLAVRVAQHHDPKKLLGLRGPTRKCVGKSHVMYTWRIKDGPFYGRKKDKYACNDNGGTCDVYIDIRRRYNIIHMLHHVYIHVWKYDTTSPWLRQVLPGAQLHRAASAGERHGQNGAVALVTLPVEASKRGF